MVVVHCDPFIQIGVKNSHGKVIVFGFGKCVQNLYLPQYGNQQLAMIGLESYILDSNNDTTFLVLSFIYMAITSAAYQFKEFIN